MSHTTYNLNSIFLKLFYGLSEFDSNFLVILKEITHSAQNIKKILKAIVTILYNNYKTGKVMHCNSVNCFF